MLGLGRREGGMLDKRLGYVTHLAQVTIEPSNGYY